MVTFRVGSDGPTILFQDKLPGNGARRTNQTRNMRRGAFTSQEIEATRDIMGGRQGSTQTIHVQERAIIQLIRQTDPLYVARPMGAYRRWYRTHESPQLPIRITQTFDSDSDSDSDVELMSIMPRRTPALSRETPVQTLKRTLDAIHDIADLDKALEEFAEQAKRRKKELEDEANAMPSCGICHEEINNDLAFTATVASCGHIFCTQCYISHCSTALTRYSQRYHQCPVCRANWDKPTGVHIMHKGASVMQCKQKHSLTVN